MKPLLAILVAAPLLLTSQARAAEKICPLKGPRGATVVYRSADAYDACQAEVKRTGHTGTVCQQSIVGVVTSGTKAERLGSAGFLSGLAKVRVLEGEYAGREGVVVSAQCDTMDYGEND
jgi:hypothetical protein